MPPIPDVSSSASQPIPEKLTLENGLNVLLLPDPNTPLVNFSGWVEAGSVFDPTPKAGLASLTADNLLNGTETKDALTIAKMLEDEGTELTFTAQREGVSIQGYALNEKLPTLIGTLADVLQHATFPDDQLELSRQRALASLRAELDDPQGLSWRVFRQTIYPENHPFHSLPTEDSLNQIIQADVVNFYQTHYRPDATVLALAGNFDANQVKTLLSDALGDWNADGNPSVVEYSPVPLPDEQVQLEPVIPGKAESVTVMGYNSGISRQDPRYYAAQVLNQILGGDTLSSRLGTEIRDRQGLTYGIFSFFQSGINPGPFAIIMQTAPENPGRAINSTIAVLRQIQANGVSLSEIDTAKRSLISSYPVDLADPSTLTSEVLYNDVYGLSLEEIRHYSEKIEAVTPDQVQQVIADLIHPEKLIIVTAGPGNGGAIGG